MTPRDFQRLEGVHPDLVKIVQAAHLKSPNFFVIEGIRSIAEEAKNVAAGKSQTMNSRHIGGFAVDLGIMKDDALTWDVPSYTALAGIMLGIAADLGISLKWGGNWKTLKDYVHFELNRNFYPDIPQPLKGA